MQKKNSEHANEAFSKTIASLICSLLYAVNK